MNLTYELDLVRVKMNHHVKYLGQSLHRHTYTPDRLHYLDHKLKWSVKLFSKKYGTSAIAQERINR